jgi:hypothetical protein
MNEFNTLDAQDEISSLAQCTAEEQSEYCAWLDEQAEKWFAEQN